MTGHWRWPALVLGACALVATGEYVLSQNDTAPQPRMVLENPAFGPATYDAQFASAEGRIALNKERVARSPQAWLNHATLGSAHLAAFRTSGDSDKLVRAVADFETVRSLAPANAGAPLAAADLALAMHDLSRAEQALQRFDRAVVPADKEDRSEALAMRGDIAFYSGKPELAGQFYEQADQLAPAAGISVREAIMLRAAGDFDGALAKLASAAAKGSRTPMALANLAMQAGMIESGRGRYDKARAYFEKADELFSGYWLTQLYLAEAKAVGGDTSGAIAMLEPLATETGHPEAWICLR